MITAGKIRLLHLIYVEDSTCFEKFCSQWFFVFIKLLFGLTLPFAASWFLRNGKRTQ